jgi:hypothetical protein
MERFMTALHSLPITKRLGEISGLLDSAIFRIEEHASIDHAHGSPFTLEEEREIVREGIDALTPEIRRQVLSDADINDDVLSSFCRATLPLYFFAENPRVIARLYTDGRVLNLDDTITDADIFYINVQESERASRIFGCFEELHHEEFLNMGVSTKKEISPNLLSGKLSAVSSVLIVQHQRFGIMEERKYLPFSNVPYAFTVTPRGGRKPRHTLNAVVNPISRQSQELFSLIKFITSKLDVSSTIFLNPRVLENLDVKNFYQLVTRDDFSFDRTGGIVAPRAYFKRILSNATLQLKIISPRLLENVECKSQQDIHNIKLQGLPKHAPTLRISCIAKKREKL